MPPVNAWPASSRTPTHDSGPIWFATPLPYGTFTHNLSPVLTGAPRPDPWIRKVIDGRYCKGSTILTTNIDFAELGDYLGDPVITAATVDRMVHHSIIINIEGPSWRLHQSQQLNSKQ